MNRNPLLAIVTICAATLLGSANAAPRSRPVRRPPPPDYLVVNATRLTVTNHGAAQDVRVCFATGCETTPLQNDQTVTFPDHIGQAQVYGTDLEIRATGHDGIPRRDLDDKSVLPAHNTNPVIHLFDYVGGPRTLELRNSSGAKLAETTINLQNFTTYTTTLDALFPNSPRENLMQLMLTRGAGDADGNPSKPLNSATGLEYVLDFTGGMLKLANPAVASMNIPTTTFFVENTTHTPNNQPIATVSINNAGIAEIDPLISTRTTAKGAVSVQGSPVSTAQGLTYQPFIAWGAAFSEQDMAVARQGTNNDQRQIYDLSLNSLTGNETITVMNTSRDYASINATITGYKNGAQTSTYALPLGAKMNKTLPLSTVASGADRITLSLDNAPAGNDLTPQAAIIATNPDGEVDKGYKVARATTKVTGEEYVTKWLDSLKTQYFYLNNTEVRCMINGNCGTRSYAPDMAAVLVRATENTSGIQAAALEQILREWVDGSAQNGELDTKYDPLNTSMVNRKIGFYFPPANLSGFSLSQTDTQAWYTVMRSFLATYTQTHPEQYGGSTQTGPNVNFQPTWSSQDPN